VKSAYVGVLSITELKNARWNIEIGYYFKVGLTSSLEILQFITVRGHIF